MSAARFANFVAFQAGWFACILAAAAGQPWFGPLVVGVIAAVWLARRRSPEHAAFLLVVGVLGYFADSALVWAGLVDFPAGARLGGPSTMWMVALWINLALTLDSSLAWLRGRPATAAILGAIGGPLSYYAGARLGAVALGDLAWSLTAIGATWLAAMPALVCMSARVADGTCGCFRRRAVTPGSVSA